MQLADALRSKRQIPVQEKQRCKPLLPIQGPERSVLNVSINEIETHVPAPGDGAVQDVEEARSDTLHYVAFAPLRVVSLDERDLDTLDGRSTRGAVRK